jgi:hypothetical protein
MRVNKLLRVVETRGIVDVIFFVLVVLRIALKVSLVRATISSIVHVAIASAVSKRSSSLFSRRLMIER